MKTSKKVLLLCTMVTTLLIYGCSVEESDKNNIENNPEKNINEQIKDNENTDNNQDKDDNDHSNSKPDENEENQPQSKEQYIIIAKECISNDNKDGITILENKLKDINRESVVKTQNDSNLALMIYSNDIITDIRIHKLGEEFINMDFDIEKYLEKYIDHDQVKVLERLDTDKGLILEVWESEGIPRECITYRDRLGNLKYYIIQYDGKG